MSAPAILVADIGGTNARFAAAKVRDGKVLLGEPFILATSSYPSIEAAWPEILRALDIRPRTVSLSVAGPVTEQRARLTNGSWHFDARQLTASLAVEQVVLVNDLTAIAHAVAQAKADEFRLLREGRKAPADCDTIGVVGIGTGLGFARVERFGSRYKVVPGEAGHTGFAPTDTFEADAVARMIRDAERPTVESFLSGPGLLSFLPMGEPPDPIRAWDDGLTRADPDASLAVDRFCAALGSIVGDLALAQGLEAVVLAGGVADRLRQRLGESNFEKRFLAKGPMCGKVAETTLATLALDQPGLVGAALIADGSTNVGEIARND